MEDKILNEIGKTLCHTIKKYFESKENRKAFEKWYQEKYHKPYKWKREVN